jgi:hypothetical protein
VHLKLPTTYYPKPAKIQGLTVVLAGGMAKTAVCAFILVDTSPGSKAAINSLWFMVVVEVNGVWILRGEGIIIMTATIAMLMTIIMPSKTYLDFVITSAALPNINYQVILILYYSVRFLAEGS